MCQLTEAQIKSYICEKNILLYFTNDLMFLPHKKYISPFIFCPLQVFLLSKLTCQADYHRRRLMAEAGCNNNRFVWCDNFDRRWFTYKLIGF